MNKFRVNTPKHELLVEYYYDFIKKEEVRTNKELFARMCRDGCRNYDNKYCCPPSSPSFNKYVKEDLLLILLFKMGLFQLSEYSNEYHKIRLANAVLKSRIEKLMRFLEKEAGTNYLGTGACRLCRPCRKKVGKPCRYPDKKRYSLESIGVDCNYLSKKLFNIELKWYENKNAPEYTCVICALPVKDKNINIRKFITCL